MFATFSAISIAKSFSEVEQFYATKRSFGVQQIPIVIFRIQEPEMERYFHPRFATFSANSIVKSFSEAEQLTQRVTFSIAYPSHF